MNLRRWIIAIILCLCAAYARAENDFPLNVTGVTYNHPAGISYDPTAPMIVTLELANQTEEAVSLGNGTWHVWTVRALVGDRSSLWDAAYTKQNEIARSPLPKSVVAPGETITLPVQFTPGEYGFFMIILKLAPDAPEYMAIGSAVVHEPVHGARFESPLIVNGNHLRATRGDFRWVRIASRYGIKWLRSSLPVSSVNGSDTNFDWGKADAGAEAYRKYGVYVLGDIGEWPGSRPEIGGRPIYYRPNKANFLPPLDAFDEYAAYVTEFVKRYNKVMPAAFIRNEPWEGGSISNYHATGAYYRKLVETARKAAKKADPGYPIMGNDQITNFEDNMQMADAEDLVDITSHHTAWQFNRGAVQSAAMGKPAWETECWISHVDSFLVSSSTMKLAAGYAKAEPCTDNGFMSCSGKSRTGNEYSNGRSVYGPSPLGQVLSTWLYFVENTDFYKEINKKSLPWLVLFRGREGYEQKHVGIVIGRNAEFGKRFRGNPADVYLDQIAGDGVLRVDDYQRVLTVYDINGNPLRPDGTVYHIPLNDDVYYVRSANGIDDVEQKLAAARAQYQGNIFQISLSDFNLPLSERPPLRVTVQNGVQANTDAIVTVTPPEGWILQETRKTLKGLAPGEERAVEFAVDKAERNSSNSYPFAVQVATPDGKNTSDPLAEDLHVSVFTKGTVTIDGDLSDWKEQGALPVLLTGGVVEPDPGESYWFPFLNLKASDQSSVFCRFAGMWDDNYFYVMAEVNDPKEDYRPSMQNGTYFLTHDKPYDYLYWWTPQFLSSRGDGLKIAFNINRPGQKNDPWLPPEFQQQIDKRFDRLSADYEYDLYLGVQNKLAEPYEKVLNRHLEKTLDARAFRKNPVFEKPTFENAGPPLPEVWRFMAPGVPRHNYYPFSPRKERDQGLVRQAHLVIKRDGTLWRYEAAIPWEELTEIKPAPGREVRFSFYVLNNGVRALSWTRDRSACRSTQILHPTWKIEEGIETSWRFVDLNR